MVGQDHSQSPRTRSSIVGRRTLLLAAHIPAVGGERKSQSVRLRRHGTIGTATRLPCLAELSRVLASLACHQASHQCRLRESPAVSSGLGQAAGSNRRENHPRGEPNVDFTGTSRDALSGLGGDEATQLLHHPGHLRRQTPQSNPEIPQMRWRVDVLPKAACIMSASIVPLLLRTRPCCFRKLVSTAASQAERMIA